MNILRIKDIAWLRVNFSHLREDDFKKYFQHTLDETWIETRKYNHHYFIQLLLYRDLFCIIDKNAPSMTIYVVIYRKRFEGPLIK